MCLEFLPIALLKRLFSCRQSEASPLSLTISKDFNTSAALEPVNARPQSQARHIY